MPTRGCGRCCRIASHSAPTRIFPFAAGHENPLDGEFFIGSADWMVRNLSTRVEVVTPVIARSAREKLWEILDVLLRDQRQAWRMDADGQYTQLHPKTPGDGPESLGTHEAMIALTRHRQALGV